MIISSDLKSKFTVMFFANLAGFISAIAMLIVGSLHYGPEFCKLDVSLYLIINGSQTLFSNGCKLLNRFILNWEHKTADILALISFITDLSILIWGSVVVFGNYSNWTDTDESSEFYCDGTPAQMGFVGIIVTWVVLFFIFSGILLSYIWKRKKGSQDFDDAVNP